MTSRRLRAPFRLTFHEVARHRPVDLLSPFVQHDRTEGLDLPPGSLARFGPGPRAPFCAVVVDVAEVGRDGGVRCGLAGTGGVLATYRAARQEITLEVDGPAGAVVVGAAPAEVAAPFRLACVVNENQVSVLVAEGAGEGWRPYLSVRDRVADLTDLRDPAVLGSLEYGCGGVDAGAVISRVRAGYSGAIGLRDPQVVRRPDGSPVLRDGRLFVTATNAGHGFFQQAHWGVWALDVADPSARPVHVATLFSERDGLLLGDHAGALVLDEEADRWLVLVSSWGDHSQERGVHVRHATVRGTDLLNGVHVLRTDRLELPTTASAWDPSVARVRGRWYLAFTECTSFGPPRYVFHPALATTAGAEPTAGLERVGADAALQQAEGTILQRFGRVWYLLASDRDAAEYPVYDLGVGRVGALRAPYGSNIPHPMVLATGRRPRRRWWLVSFDGTPWHEEVFGYGTHGDLLVMAGRPPAWRETLRAVVRALAGRVPGGVRRRVRGLRPGRPGRPGTGRPGTLLCPRTSAPVRAAVRDQEEQA
ncbi:hypothetical protein [Blastococcus montanus]|uniref:hypothetical protein n=1 Tax=Blastococcus montanus TaxID=3144973 RepID=UPI003209A514